MRKLFLLVCILALMAFAGTAIADTYVIAKNDKVKTKKIKKEKKQKGPSAKAIEHANPNAKFKRYQDMSVQEKKDLKKKKWDEMSEEEQGTVSELYKRHKGKLDEVMRGKKTLGEVK